MLSRAPIICENHGSHCLACAKPISPYPTADAYEAACRALHKREDEVKELSSKLGESETEALEWKIKAINYETRLHSLELAAAKVIEQAWKVPPSVTEQIPALSELSAALLMPTLESSGGVWLVERDNGDGTHSTVVVDCGVELSGATVVERRATDPFEQYPTDDSVERQCSHANIERRGDGARWCLDCKTELPRATVEKRETFCARCGSDQHELSEGRCSETPGYE